METSFELSERDVNKFQRSQLRVLGRSGVERSVCADVTGLVGATQDAEVDCGRQYASHVTSIDRFKTLQLGFLNLHLI